MTWYKKSYYNTSKTTNGLDGKWYDSMLEASYANELYAKLKNKEIKDYETQVRMDLIVNGYKVCTYIADFIVTHLDDSKEICETKGWATDYFKLKWKLLEALHGEEYTLTLLQQGKQKFRHAKRVIEF